MKYKEIKNNISTVSFKHWQHDIKRRMRKIQSELIEGWDDLKEEDSIKVNLEFTPVNEAGLDK